MELPKNEKGSALLEYAILTAFIALGVSASMLKFGGTVRDSYQVTSVALEDTAYGQYGNLKSDHFVSEFKDMKVMGMDEDYLATLTFIQETAGFKNSIGMLKIGPNGEYSDVQIVFANSSAKGSGGKLIPGVSSVQVPLQAGDQVAFFVASNAYRKNKKNNKIVETGNYVILDADGNQASMDSDSSLTMFRYDEDTGKYTPVKTQYGTEMFFSLADPENNFYPNNDAYPHTVGHVNPDTGIVTLGFEDLWKGGDHDYNDFVMTFDIGAPNARVLAPNLDYNEDDYNGYTKWIENLFKWAGGN